MKLHNAFIVGVLFFTILLIILPFTQQKQDIRQQAAAGAQIPPHVVGSQIVDSSGKPLIFRGVQSAGPLVFQSGWQSGQDPATWLNPTSFAAMASWHINVLRLPVSTWYYNQGNFMTKLDTIVQQANQAGIYVIIGGFDNAKSGSPYGMMADVPKAENVTFWQFMASHFANNSMVMFDLLNEPSGLTAQNYLNGGGSVTGSTGKVANIVGFQPMITAIRQAGAKQIIILPAVVVSTTPSARPTDPNIMYTVHIYSKIGTGNPATWDSEWGSLKGHYPLFYGEWAVLPNSLVPVQCQPYSPANADTDTNTFLKYMEQNNMHWTAWQFRQYYLIQSETTWAPTTFAGSWTACNTGGQEGMGTDIKNYLLHANPIPSGGITPPQQSVTPGTSTTPSIIPGNTALSLTLFLHGIGLGGDNANPHGTGNTSPLHQTKNVTLTIVSSNNQPVTTAQGTVMYNQSSQNFQGTISISNVPSGSYLVSVKMDGFLSLQISSAITITTGQTNTLPLIFLVTGDVNNDNQLDILDYNILLGCFGSKQTSSSCTAAATQQSSGADINDDGKVDGIDYNLFLREMSVPHGG